eukprot:g20092.t1
MTAALHDDNEISLIRPDVVTIRSAKPRDLPALNEMIALLAAHHNDAAAITPEKLERDLFGDMPWITAIVAEAGSELIGYAILVPLYRAQEGSRGMDLHHLFVRDGHRGHGIGQHLVARAREIAMNAGCGYLRSPERWQHKDMQQEERPMTAIAVALTPDFADWECALLMAVARSYLGVTVKTATADGRPVMSMGGPTVMPDHSYGDIGPEAFDALVVPGGLSWENGTVPADLEGLIQRFHGASRLECVIKGWAPAEKFVTKETPIVAFGSCFAANISNYLHERGYTVLTKRDNRAYVTRMGDGIVNTFAILQQFEWAWLNKTPAADLWHGYKAEEFGYEEAVRLETKALFDEAELFIITLGLSEIWYDEVTQEVFWRAVPAANYDANRHKFRVATQAETLENLNKIRALIREHRPEAHVLFSVSPIPLTASFRPISCISADSASKAILRAAIDEFMRLHADDDRVHYVPTFEAVKRLYNHPWSVDRRHLYGHVLDFNMRMFETYFCTPGHDKAELERVFKESLAADMRLGMRGPISEGLSYAELREQRIEAKKAKRIQARVQAREQARLERIAERRDERQLQMLEKVKTKRQQRRKALMVVEYAAKAAVAALAINGLVDLAL